MIRLLCDEHVPDRYLDAFAQQDWIEVVPAKDRFGEQTVDSELADFAERRSHVIVSNDADFFMTSHRHGFLYYEQPAPDTGRVVRAIKAIHEQYDSEQDILEVIPGEWA